VLTHRSAAPGRRDFAHSPRVRGGNQRAQNWGRMTAVVQKPVNGLRALLESPAGNSQDEPEPRIAEGTVPS
jgi:hypothetical protein